jgi:hypothetical protein
MSQLGYMFMAVGAEAYQAGLFHMLAHAFFKALLFLSSGAVILACHHEQNIFKMGGLRKKIPFVFWCFVIGGGALAALPIVTVGFFSKEAKDCDWIERAMISRSWPATLSLKIVPYEVKLLYMAKAGKLVPIIKDGSFLTPVEAKQAPDVALLQGESFANKNELRKKAVDVIEQIPAEGSFSRKTISEIRYDGKEGFWMTMIKTGVQVKIGDDQVALKANRVSKVVDYLENRQFDARVIDANLSKKVLVRLRKDP